MRPDHDSAHNGDTEPPPGHDAAPGTLIHWSGTPKGGCFRKDAGTDVGPKEVFPSGSSIQSTGEASHVENVDCPVCATFTPDFVVCVTWFEPESGVAIYGPFTTYKDGIAAIQTIKEDFINEWPGEERPTDPPEDVVFDVLAMSKAS